MGVGGGGRLVRAGGRERCGERPSTCHGGKREGMVVVANAKKKTAAQKWMRTTKGGAGRERVDGGGAVGGNAVATVSMEGSIATDIPTAVSRVLVVGAGGRTGRRVVRQLYDKFTSSSSSSSTSSAAATQEEREAGNTNVDEEPERKIIAAGRSSTKVAEALKEVGVEGKDNPLVTTCELDIAESSAESIAASLQDVDSIVCCVGANEGPALLVPQLFGGKDSVMKVENDGVISLIKAATTEGSSVRKFILVTSLGTGKFGLPAALLNAGGLLDCKRYANT